MLSISITKPYNFLTIRSRHMLTVAVIFYVNDSSIWRKARLLSSNVLVKMLFAFIFVQFSNFKVLIMIIAKPL